MQHNGLTMDPLQPRVTGTSTIESSGARYDSGARTGATLALLRELESSLVVSQQALLTRDLEGMQRGTEQQKRLQHELLVLWDTETGQGSGVQESAWFLPGKPSPKELQGSAELAVAIGRILHLARVQAGLLIRAQRSLKLISRLLTGPQINYEPPATHTIAAPGFNPVFRSGTGLNKEVRCRA
jgi:hypothetical protein